MKDERHRCYYFSADGTSWFMADKQLRDRWNSLCRRLFSRGEKPTRQDYINFLNRNHEI